MAESLHEKVYEFLKQHPGRKWTVPELADYLGVRKRPIYNAIDLLEARGKVKKIKDGWNMFVVLQE